MAALPGEGFAKLLEPVVRWFMTEPGYASWKKAKAGAQLEQAANDALRAWMLCQTPENWKAYEDAKNALVAWGNSP